nr:SdpI family protein [Anaerococcus octavius]
MSMNFEKIVISLLPIVGLFLSFYYNYKAKGNISKYSGFRTALSIKSKENWEYAHKYAAKLLRIYAIFFILLNIIIIFSNSLNNTTMTIIVVLQMLFYFIIGYRVNKDLLKKEND